MHPWHDVSPEVGRLTSPREFRAVIEIPQGSSNKYELDKPTGLLKLDRVLSSAVFYPANYGLIPQTLAEDGDPLGVLVFCSEDIPPLCLCEARAVGLMTMMDEGKPDHKVVAVLVDDPVYGEFRTAGDFPAHTFRMLKRFFEDYKLLEDKEVGVGVEEVVTPDGADEVVASCLRRYEEARRDGAFAG